MFELRFLMFDLLAPHRLGAIGEVNSLSCTKARELSVGFSISDF